MYPLDCCRMHETWQTLHGALPSRWEQSEWMSPPNIHKEISIQVQHNGEMVAKSQLRWHWTTARAKLLMLEEDISPLKTPSGGGAASVALKVKHKTPEPAYSMNGTFASFLGSYTPVCLNHFCS